MPGVPRLSTALAFGGLLGLIAQPCSGYGGVAVVAHYTTEDGLSSNLVRDVLPVEESLWVATDDAGLCLIGERGRVTCYRQEDTPLPSDRFSSLAHFRGKVYAGSADGLAVFDGESWSTIDRVDRVRLQKVHLSVDADRDELWAGAVNVAGGLVKFDGEEWTFLGGGGKGLVNYVISIAFAGGSVWLGTTGNGLFRITDGTWENYGREEGLAAETVSSLAADGPALWVGTRAGLGRLLDGEWLWITDEEGLPSAAVRSLEATEEGILVGTSRGLAIVDPDGGAVEVVELADPPPVVTSIRRDRTRERVWAGTTGGVYQLALD
ncbi:hypothetical protein N9903_00655 [bacterium]|nr:hypothetical protein [bacterium]